MRNIILFRVEAKDFQTVLNLGQKFSEEKGNQAACSLLLKEEFLIHPDLNAVDNLMCKSLVSGFCIYC